MPDPVYNHAAVNNLSCLHSVILLLALHLCLFTMIGMLLFAKTEVCACVCVLGQDGTLQIHCLYCTCVQFSVYTYFSCEGPKKEWRVGVVFQGHAYSPLVSAGAAHHCQQPRWCTVHFTFQVLNRIE